MRLKILLTAMLAGPALVACSPSAPGDDSSEIETAIEALSPATVADDWSGQLKLPGRELLLVFHIAADDDGALTVTMDSPDQGAAGIAGENARIEDGAFKAEFPAVGGSFQMRPAEDGKMQGTWSQGLPLPITLERGDLTPERARPQEPTERPYQIEQVRFPGGADTVELAGELTLPEGEGPFPALILISGSGPQDRNEELMQHKPFLILSDYLTRRGYAVLRYDDRGTAESTGDFKAATSADFAEDAAAAYRFITADARIDPGRVAYVGHSEGGLVGPLAAELERPAAMVLLAAPSRTLAEIILQQTGDLMQAEGMPGGQIDLFKSNITKVQEALRTSETLDEAKASARTALEGSSLPESAMDAQIEQSITPWMKWILDYDPVPTLEGYDGPVLGLFGSKDLQVAATENAPGMAAALQHPGSLVTTLEGLNHLFQPAETGAMSEYINIETTFDEDAMDVVADWLDANL